MLILALMSPETPVAARAVVQLDWFGALGLGVWVTALLSELRRPGPGLDITVGAGFIPA